MPKVTHQTSQRLRRKHRVSAKISGTKERPRLHVFRSNRFIYCQVIDDQVGHTMLASNQLSLAKTAKKKPSQKQKITKTEASKLVAADLVKKLKAKKVTKLRFDRGQYKYHGRIQAIAQVLRDNGINI